MAQAHVLRIKGAEICVTVNPDGTATFRQADIMACLDEMIQENKKIRQERDKAVNLAHCAIQAEREARQERDKAMELAHFAIQEERNARKERNKVLLSMAQLVQKAKQ